MTEPQQPDSDDTQSQLVQDVSEIARAMGILGRQQIDVGDGRQYRLTWVTSSGVRKPALRVIRTTSESRWWGGTSVRTTEHDLTAHGAANDPEIQAAFKQFAVDQSILRMDVLQAIDMGSMGSSAEDQTPNEAGAIADQRLDDMALQRRAAGVRRSIASTLASSRRNNDALAKAVDELSSVGADVTIGALNERVQAPSRAIIDALRDAAAELGQVLTEKDAAFELRGRTYVRPEGGGFALLGVQNVGWGTDYVGYLKYLTVPDGLPTDGTYPWQVRPDTVVPLRERSSLLRFYATAANFEQFAKDLPALRQQALVRLARHPSQDRHLGRAAELLQQADAIQQGQPLPPAEPPTRGRATRIDRSDRSDPPTLGGSRTIGSF